jgi:hypothetical protein
VTREFTTRSPRGSAHHAGFFVARAASNSRVKLQNPVSNTDTTIGGYDPIPIVLAGAVCFSAGVLATSAPLSEFAMVVGALIGIIGLLQWLRSYWPGSSGMT